MEVLGLILGLLGLLFTYIWKTNGKLQKAMMQALERIEENAVRIEEGQRDIAIILQTVKEGQSNSAQILNQGQRDLAQMVNQGQRELAQMVKEGQRDMAQMLFNQTKILERMDSMITALAA